MKDVWSRGYKCKHDEKGVQLRAIKMIEKANGQVYSNNKQVLSKIKVPVPYQKKTAYKKYMKKQGSVKKWCYQVN